MIDKILGFLKPQIKEQARETLEPAGLRKIKLGLIVGHDSKEGGAALTGTPFNEYHYNLEVANLAKKFAEDKFIDIEVEVITRDKIGMLGAYKKAEQLGCDFVIELHFNAFNRTARGTETLTSADQDSRDFAEVVHARCISTFKRTGGTGDRGVRVLSRNDRGGKNVYAFKGPSCLVEPFFGDHPDEAVLALSLQTQYAKDLVDCVRKYAMRIKLLTA